MSGKTDNKNVDISHTKKRGGTRQGAGRPPKLPFKTTTIRVPELLKKDIYAIIDMYLQSYTDNQISFIGCSGIRQRLHALELIERLAEHEKLLINNYNRLAQKEEEDKRQMKLFDD